MAPVMFDGLINGERFLTYVNQALVPALQRGDIVLLDNLSSHKIEGERAAIEAVGAEIDDLRPIRPI